MLGLYDLALGSNKYIVTSPMLNNVTIKRDNGLQITIKTDDQTQNNVYIKSATLDGSSFNDVSLTASSLLSGNHTLSYQMSNTPTQWGDRSITGGTKNSFDDLLLDKTLTTTDGIDIGNLDDIVDGDITTYLTTSGNSIAVQ
jgi:putative alpha-1,2-mannosidase